MSFQAVSSTADEPTWLMKPGRNTGYTASENFLKRPPTSYSMPLLQRQTVTISSSTPPDQIIRHLTGHGCIDLTHDLDPPSSSGQPTAYGGFGLVYNEKLRDGRRVAIKALRVSLNTDDEADKLPKNNVLVSNEGVPMITDFGNAILQQGTLQFTETAKQSGFAPRWTAPEILDEREVRQSKESDVYALGMEIITGKVPYSHINNSKSYFSPLGPRTQTEAFYDDSLRQW
ncbi:hypothetical protein FRC10_000804 [Ceratobasidium sp. 414]|nr:hypothetical protein FRC10_000804 [Ceratobasidium sp. 414]